MTATSSAMRRRAIARAVDVTAPKMQSRWPRALACLKAASSSPITKGEETTTPRGVEDHGTFEEGGPATWEVLISPRESTGDAESRRSVSDEHAFRMHAALGEEQASVAEVDHARGMTTARVDEDQEVGGPHTSDDAGERLAPGPRRAKAARADTNFRREPCPMHRRRGTCHRNY